MSHGIFWLWLRSLSYRNIVKLAKVIYAVELLILCISNCSFTLPFLLLKFLFLLEFSFPGNFLFSFLLKFCKFFFLCEILILLLFGNYLGAHIFCQMLFLIHELHIPLTFLTLFSLGSTQLVMATFVVEKNGLVTKLTWLWFLGALDFMIGILELDC